MSVESQVESNVRDRIGSVSIITDNAVTTGRKSIDHLKKIEPVQAVTSLAEGILRGTVKFVGKQAEITRRWLR